MHRWGGVRTQQQCRGKRFELSRLVVNSLRPFIYLGRLLQWAQPPIAAGGFTA
jgi:hypothetical protein